MKSRFVVAGTAIASILTAAACGSSSSSSGAGSTSGGSTAGGGSSATTYSINLGVAPDMFFSPLYIADSQGFFKKEGVNVTSTSFGSGTDAAQALLTSQLDMTAETQNLGSVLPTKGPVKMIGAYMNAPKWWAMVARPGLKDPSNLAGKRVATQTHAQGEEWLGLYEKKHNIDPTSVKFSDVKFAQLIPALNNGSVDIIIVFQPNVDKALATVPGSKVIAWGSDDDLAPTIGFLVAGKKITGNPALAKRVLLAIRDADNWINQNPDQAAALIANKASVPESDVKSLLPAVKFQVDFTDNEVSQIDTSIKFLISQGAVPPGTTSAQVIDRSFVQSLG